MKSLSIKTVASVLTTCCISLIALIQSPLESKADQFCRNIKSESKCQKLKDVYEGALKPYVEVRDSYAVSQEFCEWTTSFNVYPEGLQAATLKVPTFNKENRTGSSAQ